MPRTRIRCSIAVQRRLPSTGLFGASKEGQFRGVPVARHEAVEVVLVPGILLRAEDVLDGIIVRSRILLRYLRGCEDSDQEKNNRQTSESVLTHDVLRNCDTAAKIKATAPRRLPRASSRPHAWARRPRDSRQAAGATLSALLRWPALRLACLPSGRLHAAPAAVAGSLLDLCPPWPRS